MEVRLDAKKDKPQQLSLGGKEGFLYLLKGLRTIPSLKGQFEASKSTYPESESHISIQTACFARNIYVVQSTRKEGISYLAESTIAELLAKEKLILAAIEALPIDEIEDRFNNMVQGCVSDRTAFFEKVMSTENLTDLEIMLNFEHLFNLCVDKASKKQDEFDEESF